MQTKNCEKCNKEFTKKWPYQMRKARFCSQKCSNSVLWKNHIQTDEHKKKLQEGRSRFVYTPEIKEKMSAIKKEQFANGITPWNKDKVGVYSEETKESMGSNRGKYGELSHAFKHGETYFSVRAKRKRENGGSHNLGEWETLKKQYNNTCPCCKEQLELVKDHIIPLAKGGSDNIENIQPLCRSCNAKKHTTIIRYELIETKK